MQNKEIEYYKTHYEYYNEKVKSYETYIINLEREIIDLNTNINFRNVRLREQLNEYNRLRLENEKLYIELELNKSFESLVVKASAYTASPDETNSDPGNTATMTTPIPGQTLAVSRDLDFLIGHWVFIEDIGFRKVEDRMHPRWTNKIDILFNTKEEARQFGVQDLLIVVLDPEINLDLEEFNLDD